MTLRSRFASLPWWPSCFGRTASLWGRFVSVSVLADCLLLLVSVIVGSRGDRLLFAYRLSRYRLL